MQGAWAWARAEIRARWRGLVAVGVLVGLLAAVTMTALAGARRTASSYDRFREATLAHDASGFGPDADAFRRIAALPQVEAASIATGFPAFIDFESSFDIGLFAPPDGGLLHTVDRGALLSGRRPRPDVVDEVAINPSAASLLRAQPGTRVRLETLTPDQQEKLFSTGEFSGRLEGPVLSLLVTGVVRNAEDLKGDDASNIVIATPAFHRAYADRVGRFAEFAAIRLRGGTGSFDAFARAARPILGTEGEVSLTGAHEVSQAVRDSLRVLTVGLTVLGLAALLVGLVAGSQALGRQLWLAGPDQPVLGALGLTRRARALALAMTAVPVAVVAAGVGAIAALLASPLTPINLGREAEPSPGIALDPVVHLGGAAALALAVLAAALLVGFLVAGYRETATPSRVRPTAATKLSAALGLGPTAATGVRMALERGAGRASLPVRSALVASLVAVGGMAAASTFNASLDRLTTTPARYGSPWDLAPEVAEDDVPRMLRQRDVAAVSVVSYAAVEFGDGRGATAYAAEHLKGNLTLTVLEGRAPLTDGEVALGPDQLRRLHRGTGDTVDLKAEGGPVRLRITGTMLTPGLDDDPLADGVFVTPGALERVGRSEVSWLSVLRWASGVDHGTAKRRFFASFPGTASAYADPRPPGEVVNLSRVGSLPQAFGAFLAFVGVAGLLHALVTSARRRRHDLAVLRALGFLRRQLGASVAWQSTTITAFGLLVGVPLGIAVGRWVWIVVADGVGVANDPLVPVLAAALLVPAALLASNLVAAPLGVRASRIPPATVLRTE